MCRWSHAILGTTVTCLKAQYDRLRDALDGYYSGKQEQVLNVAPTIRVLVHDKPGTPSRSLLSRLNPDYWDLTIYDKPPLTPNTAFAMRTSVVMGGEGSTHIMRPVFMYQLHSGLYGESSGTQI